MSRPVPQSALRYPLTAILGSEAKARVMRELTLHGKELSASALTMRTGLTKASVLHVLAALEAAKAVEAVGSGRTRLFRVSRSHPLSRALQSLFSEEERRFDAILQAIRSAAEGLGAGVVAAWLYGSAARGSDLADSDVDVAVVAEPAALRRVEHGIRERLHEAEDALSFTASVVAVDVRDVLRLAADNDPWWVDIARDAVPLIGDPPVTLLARLRRHRQASRRKAS